MSDVYLDRFLNPISKHTASDWMVRHKMAVLTPKSAFERALVHLLAGWLTYADAVKDTYGSGIGGDYVLGPQWSRIGAAIRGLLDGEAGRFDCGTLDSLLCETLQSEGFNPEDL